MSVYLTLSDVCKRLGKKTSSRSLLWVAKDVADRIARAKGKLDRYDPRPRSKGQHWRFTEVGLKYIYPEFHDRRDAVERELSRRFKAIEDTIKDLQVRVETVQNRARACDDVLVEEIRNLRTEIRTGKRAKPAA